MSDLASRALGQRGGVLMIMNSLSQGGGDRVAVLVANGLAGANIPVRIVLLRDAGQPEVRKLLHDKVSLVSGGPPMGLKLSKNGQPLGHRHLERLRGLGFIRRQIDEFKPAIVFGGSDNMAYLTARARRRKDKGIRFGFKLTNRLSRPNIGPGRRLYRNNLFRFIFDRLDFVLTLADAERDYVLSVHPGREKLLKTVPNPYVTDEMLVDPKPRAPGPPRLIAAGRMVRQKRFDNLLRAFAQVQHADATLTILGDGPLRPRLEQLAQSLGIADRVSMPGYVGDIIPSLRESDLFVLSSDYEGLPGVILEALACNVPVATTESFFAARELLGKISSCAVVPIGDPAALAGAIDDCLKRIGTGPDLRSIAQPYRIKPAIKAHIATLAAIFEELRPSSDGHVKLQKRTEIPV